MMPLKPLVLSVLRPTITRMSSTANRGMTRQHAILDPIDVKRADTAGRIMRRRHMVQPPRFKGRLPDHFLIVGFISEVIPQIPLHS